MPFAPILHAELLKIGTLRSLYGALLALLAVSTAFSAIAGGDGASDPESDVLFTAFSGVLPGQIAVIAFGALTMSAEFHSGALRLSLAAVPRRGRWFAAKALAVGVPAFLVGLVTAAASLGAARASMGAAADGLTTGQQLRAVLGCGIYLGLMALLATGLAALLRSGVGALSIIVPFVLVVPFVIGDVAGKATDFLPDRAGQVALHQTWDGTLSPWTGLAVTAAWAAAALAAGAWSVRRRDA
ncbi:ABC transporter permease [Streptomyces sp. enrichment culture]|uniref:ABC transporter permease n=1 Tax=Streptomyces sp. enrichment culture TaxID=1795815 RepID=UPI003F563337